MTTQPLVWVQLVGIGLYLAQSIARIHKGRIEATSPGPGKGSVFTVSLPMQ